MLADFNKAESSVSFNAADICRPGGSGSTAASAIDAFYEARDCVIHWAYQAPFTEQPELRANLLLIAFSAAETYFRRILAEALTLCPLAAECAAQQQVPLGAITSFGLGDLGLAISDTKGLTSSGEILQRTRNLLGINIQKTSSVGVAIDQFERICNLRHSIVHSSRELLYNNRRELSIKGIGRLQIEFDDKSLQDVVQIVVNAVRAFNNNVANEMLQRWFASGQLTGVWSKDKKRFTSFYGLFTSARDGTVQGGAFPVYKLARSTMRKEAA